MRVARKVLSGKHNFNLSENAWDWLGHGVYFWEDSPLRANRWAQDEHNRDRSQIKHPVVAGAVINLGNCLNLADAEALKQIETAHKVYVEICAENGDPVAQNRGTEPLYEGAGFRELDHIQICVRSPKQIIGCFWPRP